MLNKLRKLVFTGTMMLAIVMCIACGKKEETQKISAETNEVKNEIQEVQDFIKESAEELSSGNVGEYVTPDESCFTWEQVDGGVALTGYTGSEMTINIPENLGGMNVVEIRGNAFSDVAIVGVKLPDTVKIVGENAFFYCTSLVELQIGKNVQEIGAHACEGCSSLMSVSLNDGLVDIKEYTFGYCSSLKKIELPSNLQNIGEGAFALSGLESILIPATVMCLHEGAFQMCSELVEVNIQDGVSIVEDKVFETCNKLQKVTFPVSISEMGIRIFNHCENVTIYAPSGSLAESYANENGIPFQPSEG